MGYSLAIGPALVQFPQSRAVVPQTARQSPRVEEILGTAKVIRQDESAAKPQNRANRRDGGDLTSDRPDPDTTPALSFQGRPDSPALSIGQLSIAGASTAFVAQLLGQASAANQQSTHPDQRNGAELTSMAYRRAGGEPSIHSSDSALVRLAV